MSPRAAVKRRSGARRAARRPVRRPSLGPATPTAGLLPRDTDTVQARVGGRTVPLTNLRKPFWPAEGLLKRDLLQYYSDVAPVLLPHLRDRAMVMKRYPNGADGAFFFMKRAPSPRPDWIETCSIEHGSGSVIAFPMVQDLASLLWVVNLGCIDLNQWYARCDDTDRPDYVHFDLDPVKGATFEQVRECALVVREALDKLGMPSYPKSTGSRGIHVYVPIVRGPTQKEVWTIAKAIAQTLAVARPALITAEYRIAKRPGGACSWTTTRTRGAAPWPRCTRCGHGRAPRSRLRSPGTRWSAASTSRTSASTTCPRASRRWATSSPRCWRARPASAWSGCDDADAYRGAHPRSAGSSRIDVNTPVACTSSAAGVTRAKPKTVMPAAFAASTPVALSSMTTHRAGGAPHARAACTKRSGAGLPRLTSSALKMRSPKRASSPVASSDTRMRSWVLLEVTQTLPSRSSTSATPGTGASARRNRANSSM